MAVRRLNWYVPAAVATVSLVAAAALLVLGRSPSAKPELPVTERGQVPSSRPPPELRGAAEAELAGSRVDSYSLALETGQYLHLVVDQLGVDVVVTLVDPAGREVAEIDRLDGPWGPERLDWIASDTGRHRFRIRPWQDSGPGRYRAVLEAIRTPTGTDLDRVRAAEAFDRAAALEGAGAAGLRDAAAGYEDAMLRWRRLGEPLLEAVSALRAGRAHSRLGELSIALRHYGHSIALLERTEHRGQEASALISIAPAYRLSAQPEKALDANRRALAIYRELDHDRGEALALNNLAVLRDQAGDIEEALGLYEQALAIWERLDKPAERATTLHNIGTLYTLLGEDAESLDFLQRSLELRRRAGDRGGEAASLTAVAWVHYLMGEPEAALPRYEEALRLRREVGDRRGEAATLDRLATALVELERRPEAQAAYQQAEAILRQGGDRLGLANTLANLGWLHVDWNRPDRALAYFTEALPLLREAADPAAEAASLTGRAHAERALGDLEAARATVEAALALIEAQSRTSDRPRLRSSFIASRHDSYEFSIDLLMELHESDPEGGWAAQAFQAAERARTQGLLTMLRDSRAEIARDADPALLARRRELGERIDRLADPGRELRALLLELEGVDAEIRRQSPRYRALTDPEPLTIGEIQQNVLDEETALLAFSLGEGRSFVWLITRDSLVSRPLPPRPEIESWARTSHLALAGSHQQEARTRARIATARLTRMLLEPVADRLDARRLIVVADGALHYVPFGALPDPGTAAREPGSLLADHEIVRVPSLAVLSALREEGARRPPAPGVVAVVADPVFDSADPRWTAVAGSLAPAATEFPRLVHSQEEARAILGLVPAEAGIAALGFDASRETLLSGRLGRYRILHLATHALLDTDNPPLSSLVLSRVDAAGRPRSGFLRAHELYGLDLGAELVVLSACRTALGREVRGEGLVGLTSGFLHAGAQRVVVSLWSVSDRATAELMARFYRGMLVQGLAPSAALRHAQLSLAEEPQWRAPYFWAGFVMLGEWRGPSPRLALEVADRQDSHFAPSRGTEEAAKVDSPSTH